MRAETQLLSARSVRWLDVGVVVWIVVWIALGVLVWHDIGAQAQLSTNVIKMGAAVSDTGKALGVVGGLPLVGGQIGDFAHRIESIGAEVEASGQDSRSSIRRDRGRGRPGRGHPAGRARAPAVSAGAPQLEALTWGRSRRRCRAPLVTRRSSSTWRAAPSTPCPGTPCGRSRRTRGVTSGGASAGRSPTRSSSASGSAGPDLRSGNADAAGAPVRRSCRVVF